MNTRKQTNPGIVAGDKEAGVGGVNRDIFFKMVGMGSGRLVRQEVQSRGGTYTLWTYPDDPSCPGINWDDVPDADLNHEYMKELEEKNGRVTRAGFDKEAYLAKFGRKQEELAVQDRAKFGRKQEELAVQDADVAGAAGSGSGSAAHNDSDPPAEGSPSAAAGGVHFLA